LGQSNLFQTGQSNIEESSSTNRVNPKRGVATGQSNFRLAGQSNLSKPANQILLESSTTNRKTTSDLKGILKFTNNPRSRPVNQIWKNRILKNSFRVNQI
jgi:hypothetical protein